MNPPAKHANRDVDSAEIIRRSNSNVNMRREPMKYLLMIYGDETAWAQQDASQQQELISAYMVYEDGMRKIGAHVAGEALHPTSTATTVRVRDGKVTTTDGPFAETKEQLGGFYLIECKNLDEAIQWASKIPNAKDGSIEVRPVVDFSQIAPAGTETQKKAGV
jgi:hypothetical protein